MILHDRVPARPLLSLVHPFRTCVLKISFIHVRWLSRVSIMDLLLCAFTHHEHGCPERLVESPSHTSRGWSSLKRNKVYSRARQSTIRRSGNIHLVMLLAGCTVGFLHVRGW